MNPYFLKKLVQEADARELPDGQAPDENPAAKTSPLFFTAYILLPALLFALATVAVWVFSRP